MTAIGDVVAPPGEAELEWQAFGAEGDPALLLIAGIGMPMRFWPDGLCERLAARGFRVIRFEKGDPERSYRPSETAAFAAGLLDELGIEHAHAAGASVGGVVAQTLAIERPERVLSLASIMSPPGKRAVRLRELHLPAVVIHGDRDPLVAVAEGQATAGAIADSNFVLVPGMGHDLPRGAWPAIVEAIGENARRAAFPSTAFTQESEELP